MYLIWPLWLVSLVVWSSQHELSPKGMVCFFVVKAESSLSKNLHLEIYP